MEVSELRGIFLFTGLSDEQIAELIAHSDEFPFDDGQVLFVQGDPADFWWVLLEGRVELLRRAGREESVVATMDRPGVWAGGFRAWADSAGYLATGRAAGAGRMLRVPAASLGELVRAWFPFGIHMIEGFFQTVRNMEAMSRQREALVALGGARRRTRARAQQPGRGNGAGRRRDRGHLQRAAGVTRAPRRAVAVRRAVHHHRVDAKRDRSLDRPVDPIAVADREDALLVWLDAHGLDDGWRIAPALAAAGVEVAWCQRVADVLDPHHLGPALDWTAGTLSLAGLLQEVKESTGRVSGSWPR